MSPAGCPKMSATPCNRNADESFPVLRLKSREQKSPTPLLIQDKDVLQPSFALPHAEQAALHHLERIGLKVDQNEEQAIFRCRERTVLVHRAPAGGPRFPIEAPRGEMRLERCLKGRNEELKLVERETGQIQELRGAGLHVGEL